MKCIVILLLVVFSFSVVSQQEVVELEYEIKGKYFIPALGTSVDVYEKKQSGNNILYVKPFFKVSQSKNIEAFEALCKQDGKRPPKGEQRIPFRFNLMTDSVLAEIKDVVNETTGSNYTSVSTLTVSSAQVIADVRMDDGKWKRVVIDENPRFENPQVRHEVNSVDYGQNVYIYGTCKEIGAIYRDSEFNLEYTTPVSTTSANYLSFAFSEFYRSQQVLDLTNTEKQEGGILVDSRSSTIKSGLDLGFISAAGARGGQRVYTEDSRKRFINAEFTINKIRNYLSNFNGTIRMVNENLLDNTSLVEYLISQVTPSSRAYTFDIDLVNNVITNGVFSRTLSPNEVVALTNTDHLRTDDNREVEGNYQGAEVDAKHQNIFDQKKGITYNYDGNAWVPTSIKLYATSDIDINTLQAANFTQYKQIGDSFHRRFSIDNFNDGVEHYPEQAVIFQEILATKLTEVLDKNHKELVKTVRQSGSGATFMLPSYWYATSLLKDADGNDYIDIKDNKSDQYPLFINQFHNNASKFCREMGYQQAIFVDRINDQDPTTVHEGFNYTGAVPTYDKKFGKTIITCK